MAWSWSYSPEGVGMIYDQLHALPLKRLAEIWSEWKVHEAKEAGREYTLHDELEAYAQAEAEALTFPPDCLADEIWQKAEALATCSNGGWEAWLCPDGCPCHCAPVEKVEA